MPLTLRLVVGLVVAVVVVSMGCSLLPTERHKSQSVATTEAIATESERTTQRTLSVVPEAALAITHDSNVVSIPIGSSVREVVSTTSRVSTGAGSKDNATGSSSVTIPGFVKLIGAAIGLIGIVLAIKYALNAARGTALGQGLALADDLAARQIRKLRERASLSTDVSEQARLNQDIADLESERGRVAASKGHR